MTNISKAEFEGSDTRETGAGASVRHFSQNRRGRDFVVGDIHGEYAQLELELELLRFDRARDRLFAVGDLVDRGRDSLAALEWLAQPWFHACLGNHDEMVLTASRDPTSLFWWTSLNGGQWWRGVDKITQARFIAEFSRLPVAMEVETREGRVGIVHADVPPGLSWDEFVVELERGNADVRHYALWSRQRALGENTAVVAGVDCVFCGHTVGDECTVRKAGNVYLIDTGAGYQRPFAHLTVVPISFRQD